MTIVRLTVFAALLVLLAGCVIPLGKSTGPGDNRSPYLSNEGDRDAAPNTNDQFQPGQSESLD